MKLKFYILSAVIFTWCLTSSCDKRENETSDPSFTVEKVQIPEMIKIRSIDFYDENYGLICAGEKNSTGSIYVTYDGGRNWDRTFQSENLSVNDLCIVNDNLVLACGDDLMFLKSENKGRNWTIEEIPNYPYQNYIVPYNKIFAINDKSFFLVGGEQYDKGLISEFENTQWIHSAFYNQLNSVCFVTDYVGFFGGYGTLMFTEDGGNLFGDIEIGNSNVVSLEKDKYGNIYCLFSKGVLSVSPDYGYNWTNVITDRNNIFTNIYTGKNMSAVCGKRGILYIRYESGKWTRVSDVPDENFESVYINDRNEIFLGTDKGDIYILNRNRRP